MTDIASRQHSTAIGEVMAGVVQALAWSRQDLHAGLRAAVEHVGASFGAVAELKLKATDASDEDHWFASADASDPERVAALESQVRDGGALVVTLLGADGKLGWLAVERGADGGPFSDDDESMLVAVAEVLALAVERGRLREQIGELEASAREAQSRYELLAAASFEGIAIHVDGQHVDVNDAYVQLLGYPREEAIEKSAWDLAAPESRPIVKQHIEARSDEPYEIVGIRKDGSRVDLEVRGRTLDHRGRRVRVAALRDISERKRIENDLRASRDQIEIILRGVADGVTAQGTDLRMLFANDAAARMLGFERGEELCAASPADLAARYEVLGESGRPLAPDEWTTRRALRGEPAAATTVRYRDRATGDERWSFLTSTPVRNEDGTVRFVVNIFRDITQEKLAENRLRLLADAGARLPASLSVRETLAQGAELATATLADWSAAYAVGADDAVERVAVAIADPAKRHLIDALLRHPSSGPTPSSELWSALRAGAPQLLSDTSDDRLVQGTWDEAHLAVLRAIGISSEIWVPLVARGRTVGALALFTSGTARRFGSDDLTVAMEMGRRAALAVDNARLYEEAQKAIETRDVFLSIASHELRTPVTVLKGTAQMLERARARGTLDDRRLARFLTAFIDASDRLTELTDDLLDVGRLRTGNVDLRAVPLDLSPFVRELAERHRKASTTRHTIRADVEPGLVARVDSRRLEQIVGGLLTNAVKYSPDGGVVTVRARHADGGVLLEVRDEGIGIPIGAAESIFEPFGRAENASERQIPGMGLGLYIARGIVERQGGRIWAESAGPDQGATFSLWFPLVHDADADVD